MRSPDPTIALLTKAADGDRESVANVREILGDDALVDQLLRNVSLTKLRKEVGDEAFLAATETAIRELAAEHHSRSQPRETGGRFKRSIWRHNGASLWRG
jgi:hypothetical protein